MGELEGRVALVTGGGSGIGAGCARRLAADAATVVIADFDQSAAERVAAEIGAAASAVPVDVRDPAAVEQLVAGVVSAHGRLDIALNIAGIGGATALPAEYPIDSWRDVVDVNLSGVFYSLRAEVEVMLQGGGGSIVNMASIYGLVGMPVNIAYTAAKHGVVGITRAAALAVREAGHPDQRRRSRGHRDAAAAQVPRGALGPDRGHPPHRSDRPDPRGGRAGRVPRLGPLVVLHRWRLPR